MKKPHSLSMFVRYDIGSGRPLVLIHGLFGDGTLWDSAKDIIAQDYRVIVVDILGHGRSPQSRQQTYSPEENTQALRKTLAKLGVTKDVTIVGYSMGGAVALAYAASFPDEIEQLILIATPFYLKPEQMNRSKYASSVLMTKASTAFFDITERVLNRKFGEKLANFANKSDFFHSMIGAHDTVLDPVVVSKVIDKMVRTFDFAARLAKVTAPVTFYTGKHDFFIVQNQLEALRKYKASIDIRRLSFIKTDHMLVQNFPKRMAKLITANKQRTLAVPVDKGRGKTIVFLHGIESSASYWNDVCNRVEGYGRIVVIDLLGFGRSPKPSNADYSLEEQAKWLENSLEYLGIKTCTLVGHSLGGLVALKYSNLFPSRVQEVITFSPVFIEPGAKSEKFLLRTVSTMNGLFGPSGLYAGLLKSIGYKRLSQCMPLVRSIQNGVMTQDFKRLLAGAEKKKTKIVYGTSDWFIDSEQTSMSLSSYPKIQGIQISKGTHNLPLFAPDTASAIINNRFNPKSTLKYRKVFPSPKTIIGQIISLALPTLFLKATFFTLLGILLLTGLAPYIVVLGIIGSVAYYGIDLLKNAFSAKYEGLSYIGYLMLGGASLLSVWFVLNHPHDSLLIALLFASFALVAIGLVRIVAGLVWPPSKSTRVFLFVSGFAFFVIGLSAAAGSVISVWLMVYLVSALLLFAGVRTFAYAFSLVGLSFVRGFIK